MSLNSIIEEFLLERGALKVGFATTETLAGGPPSTDLTYRLEGARSAVSFALPLNREYIRKFLSKETRVLHENDNLGTNFRARDLSWELAGMLEKEKINSKGCAANQKYRTELENWQMDLHPDISHRYIAARSGVGSFGWSGNVGLKGIGCTIILGTTVTQAELEPTDPESDDDQFCDKCKLCVSACAVQMFDKKKDTSVTIGGVELHNAWRRNILLCHFCCGGFGGISKSGKWSTWTPSRIRLPEDEEKLPQEFFRAFDLFNKRPPTPGGYEHVSVPDSKMYMTCGNCQIACWGNKKETAENVKMLHASGCVVQKPDGEVYAVPHEDLEKELEKYPEEHRALYI